jgi:hypothetical protein
MKGIPEISQGAIRNRIRSILKENRVVSLECKYHDFKEIGNREVASTPSFAYLDSLTINFAINPKEK